MGYVGGGERWLQPSYRDYDVTAKALEHKFMTGFEETDDSTEAEA